MSIILILAHQLKNLELSIKEQMLRKGEKIQTTFRLAIRRRAQTISLELSAFCYITPKLYRSSNIVNQFGIAVVLGIRFVWASSEQARYLYHQKTIFACVSNALLTQPASAQRIRKGSLIFLNKII